MGMKINWAKLSVVVISFLVIVGISYVLMCLEKQRMLDNEELEILGSCMGTTYSVSIILPAKDKHKLDSSLLKKNIDQKILEFEKIVSVFKPESSLSLFNKSSSTDWIPVPYEIYFLVKKAKEVSILTNGKYDVTVGNLVNLWHFGPGREKRNDDKIPNDSQIKEVLKSVGYNKVLLKEENGRFYLKKMNKDLNINLSSIAKGYGVDEVSRLLSDKSYNNHKVEIGGEVKTRGKNLNSKNWVIGIERPNLKRSNLQRIALSNQAIATSGIYRNYYESEGKTYGHVIDPISGYTIDNKVLSTTVIASDCVDADSLSTGFYSIGVDEGLSTAREHHIPVYYIYLDENGKIAEKWNEDFDSYMMK